MLSLCTMFSYRFLIGGGNTHTDDDYYYDYDYDDDDYDYGDNAKINDVTNFLTGNNCGSSGYAKIEQHVPELKYPDTGYLQQSCIGF